jgi:hypothetical protein
MTDTARSLLAELAVAEKSAPEDEPFLPRHLAPRIRAVGEVTFFVELLRTRADSWLRNAMLSLSFAWKDTPYEVWRQVLREVAADAIVMYQLEWSFAELLGIDVNRMIDSDPAAQALVRQRGSYGGRPGTWWEEICQDYGIDYRAIWRRLAAEGAPMLHDVDDL